MSCIQRTHFTAELLVTATPQLWLESQLSMSNFDPGHIGIHIATERDI